MKKINIKNLGAKGDGISNDHPYFQKAKELINHHGGGELIIPPGVYYFEDFVNTSSQTDCDTENREKNIDFWDCSYIKITGYNATIKMNGMFTRDPHWSASEGKYWYSGVNALRLGFINCENIVIEGIEINGGVNDTTRGIYIDSNGKEIPIAEYHGYGIYIKNLKREDGGKPLQYLDIQNIFVHHCSTDGLGLNIENVEGHIHGRISIRNSVFDKNARVGMHIGTGHHILVDNCKFTNSGYQEYDNGYGVHAPGAGVDLESYGVLENGENPIKKIRFTGCEFRNNYGGQFIANTVTEEVTLEDCYLEDPHKGKTGIVQGIRLSGRNITLKHNIIIGDVTLFSATSLESHYPNYRDELGTHILYNRIYSNRHGIRAYSDSNSNQFIVPLRAEGNYLQMLDEPVIDTSSIDCFPLINDGQSIFTGNYIKLHPNRYQGGDPEIVSRVQECKLVTNNVWDVIDHDGNIPLFQIHYGDSNVFNESYPKSGVFQTMGHDANVPKWFFEN